MDREASTIIYNALQFKDYVSHSTSRDVFVVVLIDPTSTTSTLSSSALPTGNSIVETSTVHLDQAESNEPDMGAVYILLGCLALSGLVVLGILAYCTSYCWRKTCLRRSTTAPSTKNVHCEEGYTGIKKGSMNRRPKIIVTSADEQQTSVLYGRPSSSTSLSFNTTRSEIARLSLDCTATTNGHYQKKSSKRKGWKKHGFDHTPTSPTGMFNGTVLSLSSKDGDKLLYTEVNGNPKLASCDPLSDEIERRSILRYDLYPERSHTSVIRGVLTFALRYDYIHRVLMVHLIRASHLTDKDHSALCLDPYVKMYLLPERRNHCKSRIQRKTLDPEFNEMFSFDAPYNTLSSRMLQFTVYDFDRFTRHGLIGNVIVRDLFEKSDLHCWTEYTAHVIGDNEKDDYGDLLLYLSYDARDSKLAICVAKACNLRPMDITGASDPYVKMIQLQGRRRVKTRRTTMKRANLHPVYNEILTFDLPEAQIGNTNILIKVMDWDRIGKDDLLGSCVLGSESPTTEGREHWRQCFLRQKDKPVGMWHSLLAEVPESFTNITK